MNCATVSSGPRFTIGKIASTRLSNFDVVDNRVARCEMDNHADTCCFGSNFRPTFITDQVCDVFPFHDGYEPQRKVPVVTAVTAWDDPDTGEAFILEFHQGLWFGSTLQHSLINPNQCRAYGISICDDPYDPYRELEIVDNVTETKIPLDIEGAIIGVTTRVPTDQELSDCIYIVMTSDYQWNPAEVQMNSDIKSMHVVNRESANESDLILANISSIYSSKELVEGLIANVHVNMVQSKDRSARIQP